MRIKYYKSYLMYFTYTQMNTYRTIHMNQFQLNNKSGW